MEYLLNCFFLEWPILVWVPVSWCNDVFCG